MEAKSITRGQEKENAHFAKSVHLLQCLTARVASWYFCEVTRHTHLPLHNSERTLWKTETYGVCMCVSGVGAEEEFELRHWQTMEICSPPALLSRFVSALSIDPRWWSTWIEDVRQLENPSLLQTTKIWGLCYLGYNENLPGKNSDIQIFV